MGSVPNSDGRVVGCGIAKYSKMYSGYLVQGLHGTRADG